MTKQKNIIIMMLAFLMLLPVGSAAQEVVQKLDSLQILIGEQTKLHLKVTAAKGAKVVLPSFKPSQMLIPGIEVVEQSDADTAELDGGRLPRIFLRRSKTACIANGVIARVQRTSVGTCR